MKAIFIILAILMVTQAFKMTSKVNTKLQSQIQSKFQSKNKLASTFQTSSQLKDSCLNDPEQRFYITGCSNNPVCGDAFDCSATGDDEEKCDAVGQNVIDLFYYFWGTCVNDYASCIMFAATTYNMYSGPENCGCINQVSYADWLDYFDCPSFSG
uniref:Mating pheromone 2 n=1 Tax=Euplotoides octocarinatus TaxID=2716877 RepID=MER2_EUPOC|nr:RecName: Full=Mating pheromone 2; Flags: Precursor [Euplotes octocarinatus]CAA75580.1 pheromone 2 [Euplotes octocarinatus]